MKFFSYVFNAESMSTLIATAVSGFIVYWLSGLSFWACAFLGYLITELVSTANKVEAIKIEIQISNHKLSEVKKQNAQLSDQVWDLKERVESARVSQKIF